MNKDIDYINFIKSLQKNPFGDGSDRKWKDLSKEEKSHWDRFSQSSSMKIHALAYKAFNVLQSHGLPEDIILDELKLSSEKDKILFKKSFNFLKERHREISRRSAKKKFGI